MFDEDVAESGSEEEEADESEPLVSEQTKFSKVDKSKSYDISAYLEGIDEEESENESEECGEKDEFGNYL